MQQSIDADPLYALAYAGLADCYIVLGAPLNALPPKEAFAKIKVAATKALEIDDTLAEAHAASLMWERFRSPFLRSDLSNPCSSVADSCSDSPHLLTSEMKEMK